MNRQKITLVTSGQPSINPRLVKEADALTAAGYEVTVLYQYWNQWATEKDRILFLQKKWKAIRIGGSPYNQCYFYWVSRLLHKVSKWLFEKLNHKEMLAPWYMSRTFWLMYQKALKTKADLIIGHNPGAIAIAAKVAAKKNIPCGFDAEDFHRYEYSDDENHPDVIAKKLLEERFFPSFAFITTASPLISQHYKSLFPGLSFQTILNVFPKVDLQATKKESDQIRLFWFSQTIGHNRGLEDIMHAMHICKNERLELHVLGNKREKVIKRLQQLAIDYNFKPNQLSFYDPIASEEIIPFAQQFDIGMATETGEPFNRQICLTNKIFTYIQAGLAIVASNTLAQKELLEHHPLVGKTYKRNEKGDLATQLKYFINHTSDLKLIKENNNTLGRNHFNWERESTKLLDIISEVLKK